MTRWRPVYGRCRGIGPYGAAHVMMLLGRYSWFVLDSWTRPKYAHLVGNRFVEDAEIEERFRPYGPYQGLAFWLYLTRDRGDELENEPAGPNI
jgi:3-methyladenine DNA glycosylase/8-oxoguanine DNA glycosylase